MAVNSSLENISLGPPKITRLAALSLADAAKLPGADQNAARLRVERNGKYWEKHVFVVWGKNDQTCSCAKSPRSCQRTERHHQNIRFKKPLCVYKEKSSHSIKHCILHWHGLISLVYLSEVSTFPSAPPRLSKLIMSLLVDTWDRIHLSVSANQSRVNHSIPKNKTRWRSLLISFSAPIEVWVLPKGTTNAQVPFLPMVPHFFHETHPIPVVNIPLKRKHAKMIKLNETTSWAKYEIQTITPKKHNKPNPVLLTKPIRNMLFQVYINGPKRRRRLKVLFDPSVKLLEVVGGIALAQRTGGVRWPAKKGMAPCKPPAVLLTKGFFLPTQVTHSYISAIARKVAMSPQPASKDYMIMIYTKGFWASSPVPSWTCQTSPPCPRHFSPRGLSEANMTWKGLNKSTVLKTVKHGLTPHAGSFQDFQENGLQAELVLGTRHLRDGQNMSKLPILVATNILAIWTEDILKELEGNVGELNESKQPIQLSFYNHLFLSISHKISVS